MSRKDPNAICKNCVHYCEKKIECRLRPPPSADHHFPEMDWHEWCGHFESFYDETSGELDSLGKLQDAFNRTQSGVKIGDKI